MAKVLQLVGIKSFVSPITNGVVVTKGQTIKVDDDKADKFNGFELDSANNEHPHWIERDEGAVEKIDHDFTSSPVKVEVTGEGEQLATAVKSATSSARKAATTQRVGRATK